MADDRVFIKCDGCGGWKMLLKHYAGTGLKQSGNEIMEWLDTHSICHANQYDVTLQSPGFTLHTEEGLTDGHLQADKQNIVN